MSDLEWTGGGILPPVGTVCEVAPPIHWFGTKVRVLCHDDNAAVCRVMEGDELGSLKELQADEVRPVSTPAQIEAERREEAARQLCFDAGSPDMTPSQMETAYRLYDAGYRKQSMKEAQP